MQPPTQNDTPPAAATGVLLSVQVGLPRTEGRAGAADPNDRAWRSAIWKDPVPGPVWCGAEGLDGDGVADRRYHGGPDKAVLAYAAAHYPLWRAELGLSAMGHGAFGENLTIADLSERDACIGDTFAIGDLVLQVSQPRGPCWKIARRWRVRDLVARVRRTGRTGWYCRVIRPGEIAPGQPVVLLDRPHPEWTVARANAVTTAPPRRRDPGEMRLLAALPPLAGDWRETIAKRLAGAERPDADG